MNVSNALDVNGRPLLLKVRVLRSTDAEGLVLVEGTTMRIVLGTALKLIKFGYCERVHPRKSGSQRRRARRALAAKLAILASPAIIIERVV
jgi:hypothetical protein